MIDELIELLVRLLPLGVHLASPLQQQAYLGHLLLALHRLSVTCYFSICRATYRLNLIKNKQTVSLYKSVCISALLNQSSLLFLDLAAFRTLRILIAVSVAFFLVHNIFTVVICGKRLSCVCRIFNGSLLGPKLNMNPCQCSKSTQPLAFSPRIDNGVEICIPYENRPDK